MKSIQVPISDELHRGIKAAAWQAKQGFGDHIRSVLEEHVARVVPATTENLPASTTTTRNKGWT